MWLFSCHYASCHSQKYIFTSHFNKNTYILLIHAFLCYTHTKVGITSMDSNSHNMYTAYKYCRFRLQIPTTHTLRFTWIPTFRIHFRYYSLAPSVKGTILVLALVFGLLIIVLFVIWCLLIDRYCAWFCVFTWLTSGFAFWYCLLV